jgi:hypothetical protein
MKSDELKRIKNLRDKHLAHSLSHTKLENQGVPVGTMKHQDAHYVLDATLPIMEALYRWLDSSFSFDDSRETARENAEALWTACTFNIH